MTDTAASKFAEAEAWLRTRHLPFRRATQYQLKIGQEVSYYPGNGRIFVDGESQRRPDTGLPALAAVLKEQGYLRPRSPRPQSPAMQELTVSTPPDLEG